MHVLINGWFAHQPGTGSGQYLQRLLPSLRRARPGLRLSLLAPAGRAAEGVAPDAHLRTISRPLPPLPRQLAKLWWEQVVVPTVAREEGVDVLFVPYWAAPLWQPVPTVVTIHDLIPHLLPAYRGGLLQKLYFRLVGTSARRASGVITVSRAGKKDVIRHLAIPAGRIVPVYHGPNQSVERDQATEPVSAVQIRTLRQRFGLPARYFLYLGGFDVRKNVRGILEGYARYLQRGGDEAVQLVIGGRLPQEHTAFAPDPRVLAEELGISTRVHCIGWVEEQDKAPLYAGAVAFLFPSHYEGFGMMVLEANAAGTPVITSGTPAASAVPGAERR